jgi:HK97 family phage portal protein
MRIFGLEIRRAEKQLNPVPQRGWYNLIREPSTGAWQRNEEESTGSVLNYPTLYACVSRISQDVGKLPFLLKQEDANGIWQTIQNTAYSPVLRKPNAYQTAQQFREAWILSKLIHGNTYVLKIRDERGVVVRMFVLDPCRVMPLVSDSGDVFYQLNYPAAENLLPSGFRDGEIIIPAREIIHDRLNTFHHQLIGVPPLCAAYWPAVKNLKILKNSSEFFGNGANPGGILTAPAGLSDDDAQRLKAYWDTNFTGTNSGKVAVVGADMKFTAFAFKAADSQLVEQMRYSDEQICQPFGVPPFIVGIGTIPAGLKVDDMANVYYQFALQAHIEAMEYLLDEGLGVTRPMGVELDLNPLLRMDTAKRGEVWGKLTADGIAAPNEARKEFGLSPLEGGDTVYMQQQDFPLDEVRKNKIEAKQQPAAPVAVEDATNEEVRRLSAELWQRKALDATREAINA